MSSQSGRGMMKTVILLIAGAVFAFFSMNTFALKAFAEEDMVSLIEQQRLALQKKEETVRRETARLRILKDEVNRDIERYEKLLKEIDKSLKKAEETGNKRLKHIAKAYEAMAPEDAASRLSGLDNKTAVQILLKMKSKKAGLVIGNMKPRKATLLTKEIARLKK